MTLITFSLDKMNYALDVVHVNEIIPLPEITPMAKLPSFFCGVINLRGSALPIIDLRKRLELEREEYRLSDDIIVIHINDQTMGLIVDKVLTVVDIESSQILPPPKMNEEIDIRHLAGVVQVESSLLMLINLNAILQGVPAKLSPLELKKSKV